MKNSLELGSIVHRGDVKWRFTFRGTVPPSGRRMPAQAMADPERKAYYEQRTKKQKTDPYHMALSDYMKGRVKLGE
jgi:hypothetical protein